MDLLDRAGVYLREENEEYDSRPDSIGVSTVDHVDDVMYEISGRFPDEKSEDRIIAPESRVMVDRSTEMHLMIEEVMEGIRGNVSLKGDAEITSIHISYTGSDYPEDWSFYTSETADARVFLGVSQEYVPVDVREELLGVVLDEIRDLDPDVVGDDVKNVSFLFSDMDECLLETVRGYIRTPNPHRYYSNVDTLEEYIDRVSSDEDERVKLSEMERHEIYYRVADASESVKGDVKEVGERMMVEFIESTWDMEGVFIVEAESIYFGEFDTDDIIEESMNYFVHVPVVGEEIGVSRS